MAKIVLNDNAPAEAIHFTLAQHEFDLGGDEDSVETTDQTLIANALSHPWLAVEVDESFAFESDDASRQVRPEDDPLSAANSVAFDPEAVRAIEESKRVAAVAPLAVDAGLDQGEVVVTGRVSETLAADEQRVAEIEADQTDTTEENE